MSRFAENIQPTWELESIFPGGSASAALRDHLEALERDITRYQAMLKELEAPSTLEETKALDGLIADLQSAAARLYEANSFVGCLTAQDQHDKKAVQLDAKITSLGASFSNVMTLFWNVLRMTNDEVWEAWMKREEIAPISFVLSEKRDLAREKLAPELENLVSDLAVDGYHGWGQHYDTIVAKVGVPFEEANGEIKTLSVGQAANKLDDPDRNVRERVFASWEEAWTKSEDYCADTLNRLAGFRLKLYEKRGWDDVLKEPLAINRMSKATLDAMWQVIVENKPKFVAYLERKAKLLGVDKLSWTDVDSPLGQATGKITYEQAAEDIVKQFGNFSPKLAEFATMAFNKRWIEAEDRPGKRPGGFCTSLPKSKQTRIFMTFGGTVSNVYTLAHELGHAYHQSVMEELPMFNQDYAMNVAETASTFAEMILADAFVKNAANDQEKIVLLADKVQNSVAFFMNIHARFLFETRFYEKRQQGVLDAAELSELMEEAQREAFQEALGSYHPHFWASKLHFYITDVPFYNFPYTFGYMFSTGLYALAQRESQSFAAKYDALLRDTGRMTVEELAAKHLGVDLTKPDFWREAMAVNVADVDAFLELTK
ncbi:M3 family oligoendopeptidase [Paenibacillus sp. DXFW5]|uniref:M3 family oligoendopeptidase n=1 Tax=Paenibacillus rhizolycopersici TaxID=2780073 RepID=A0ABS2H361_9BACL|nr:M3 family oligoendopeptidase [Paenibacillus rhizolycopersici]MBM6995912.1 M3 family oligoendopeptidase [Paenibacillus rhizolycopersici]